MLKNLVFLVAVFAANLSSASLYEYCTAEKFKEFRAHLTLEECLSKRPIIRIGTSEIYRGLHSNPEYIVELQIREKKIIDYSILPYDFSKEYSVNQFITISEDGTKIPGLVFRPLGEEKPRQTVVIRTPYFNGQLINYIYTLKLIKEGDMNVVVQPARGIQLASGEFRYHDINSDIMDGQAVLNWINSKSWSNKENIPYGVSYDGYLALTTAATGDSSVKYVFAGSPGGNMTHANIVGFHNYKAYGHDQRTQTAKDFTAELTSTATQWHSEKLEKYFQVYGEEQFSYDSLVDEEQELIKKLNKTQVPIYLTYGQSSDQCSRFTMYLFDALKTPKFMHSYKEGHSGSLLNAYLVYKDKDTYFDMNFNRGYNVLDEKGEYKLLKVNGDLDQYLEQREFKLKISADDDEGATTEGILDEGVLNGTFKVDFELEEVDESYVNKIGVYVVLEKDDGVLDYLNFSAQTTRKLESGKTKYTLYENSVVRTIDSTNKKVYFYLYVKPEVEGKKPKIKNATLTVTYQK